MNTFPASDVHGLSTPKQLSVLVTNIRKIKMRDIKRDVKMNTASYNAQETRDLSDKTSKLTGTLRFP
jgi:hypothetical protein